MEKRTENERRASLPPGERTQWLMQYEHWLRLLARQEMNRRLAKKFDPSDIVQQTMIQAWQSWDQMRAKDEAQRLAWLRQILAHQLANEARLFHGTHKRDIQRESSLADELARSAARLDELLPGRDPSPSSAAISGERRALLSKVLDELPADYREVILLRNLEELTHAEVAARMGRTEAAVRMLWLRALASLNDALQRTGQS
jgi:RNA polymerase sigma-70 factor (ECF subfamily)